MRKVEILGPKISGEEKILTSKALKFVADLVQRFGQTRKNLLEFRAYNQLGIKDGRLPDFLPTTKPIRDSGWSISPVPKDLEDRRVEITGPASVRKMVVNALNSGANCYMADAEDSESPTWENIINGQINLFDAIRRRIDFTDPVSGKEYKLNEKTAVLFFRPRGWHLTEKHARLDDEPVPASLFDFGMYFYHNAKALAKKGTGVYLYLPKLEHCLEAELWNDIFHYAESKFKLPTGTIRATVLIETLPAAFQMDEILYALREHSAGLNCGRWDYIFSFIKELADHPDFVLPNPSTLKMDSGFLAPYCDLLVQTCHRRKAHAMGGMAAQSPSKDEKVNNDNRIKVQGDAAREVKLGFDGKWVSHPAYVKDAKEIFDLCVKGPNQMSVLREEVNISAADLLRVPGGERTLSELRFITRLSLQYLESWLRGIGCVALENLMQDMAMVEIFRAIIWHWRKHAATLSCGFVVNDRVLSGVISDEALTLRGGKFELAERIFRRMVFSGEFPEFLTLTAYDHLIFEGF